MAVTAIAAKRARAVLAATAIGESKGINLRSTSFAKFGFLERS